jgi:hypothetical protein
MNNTNNKAAGAAAQITKLETPRFMFSNGWGRKDTFAKYACAGQLFSTKKQALRFAASL